MSREHYDLIIIGSGIIGLATAMQILERSPGTQLAVLEKETTIAQHQTSHNSGVIHSGIYYRPGSLKAQNCTSGVSRLLHFCQEYRISYQQCGKLIVATSPEEIPRLEELAHRGKANGVPGLEMVSSERMREIEPHAKGICGLYSPSTGIIDYRLVAQAYAQKITQLGGEMIFCQEVIDIQKKDSIHLLTKNHHYYCRALINCAGLYSDRIAKLAGDPPPFQIIPFRGEYYDLIPAKRNLIKGLIYPVPDPKFPFLGVHLTRRLNGHIEAGPNAVLASAREGYCWKDISIKDLLYFLKYRGFWKMATRYWKVGLYELYRSFSKQVFLRDLQRLVPAIQKEDLVPGGAGVRAQVVFRDGSMCDDFAILERPNMIHVLNAPSPGATASLSIGEHIAEMAVRSFTLKTR